MTEFKWTSGSFTGFTNKRLVLLSQPVGKARALVGKYNLSKKKYEKSEKDLFIGFEGDCDKSKCDFVFSSDKFSDDMERFHKIHYEGVVNEETPEPVKEESKPEPEPVKEEPKPEPEPEKEKTLRKAKSTKRPLPKRKGRRK